MFFHVVAFNLLTGALAISGFGGAASKFTHIIMGSPQLPVNYWSETQFLTMWVFLEACSQHDS